MQAEAKKRLTQQTNPKRRFIQCLRPSSEPRPRRPKSRPSWSSRRETAQKSCREIDGPQAEHLLELARLDPTSDSVAHLHKSLRDTFQALSNRVEAQSLITQLDAAVTGLSGMLAATTPTPPSTDVCNDDVEMAPPKPVSDTVTRAFLWTLEGEGGALTSEERVAKNQKFQALVVDACSRLAATGERLSLTSLAKTLVGEEGLSTHGSSQKKTWTITTAIVAA